MPVKPVTTPPSISTPGPSTPPKPSQYRRSPSVTEAIQQFESKANPPPGSSSPANSAKKPSVPTPTRSGIPSRIGSTTVKSPPGSPRRDSRTTPTAATPGAGSSRMTGVRSPDLGKSGGIGLGVAGGSKAAENRRATDSRIKPTSSSIPRPSVAITNSKSRTPSSPRIPTSKPFPSSSPSLPRSTSDTFYTSMSSRASFTSRASTPSSVAGPSCLTTPKKTAVAISASRSSPTPSPSPDKRPPPLRRKSSKPDLTNPRSRSATGVRRPSHRVADLVSSAQSSATRSSKDHHSAESTVYFGEFGEREQPPTATTLESGSSPMVRKGSKSSQGRSNVTVSSHGSPPQQERISISIPKRTSSNSSSPKTPRSAGPHPISPRTTSRRLSSPTKESPNPNNNRRASKNLGLLGPALEMDVSPLERSPHRRGSSQSSVSRLSEAASTIREPIKRPTSAAPGRSKGFPSTHSSPRLSPPASPRGSVSPSKLVTRRLSNSPRKSPNLTIQTPSPPSLLNSRLSSISSSAHPSPPVPAKSPLRGLSRQSSDQNFAGRKQTSRSGSGESNMAQAGTPTSLHTRLEKMSEMEKDVSKRSTMVAESRSSSQAQIASSSSQIIATPNEIRFTNCTVPSVYSQDSAPPTAHSWAWSEATARSSVDGVTRRRQSRLDSVEWGKQKEIPPSSQRSSFDAGREGGHRRSSSLPRLSMISDKALPHTPDETPSTATTFGSHENSMPSSPISNDHREPAKSPSMPILREGKIAHHIHTPEIPLSPALLSSPNVRHSGTTETTLRPLLPTSPSIVMSKRTHLIREVASSERAYAKDLALVRDAYMYRFLRPASQYSTNGDSSISPSDVSRRSSVYTYQTAETKRSSGHDSPNWIFPANGSSTPLPKSPSDGYNLGYFPNSAAGSSNSSFSMTPQPSLRNHKRSSSSMPSMAPPVGKPLSPADLKTVFLNLDQLASAADELATAFEQAMGEEDTGLAAMVRDGEAGNDRLGQAFVSMIPRIRPLYNFYCARQSQASLRLMELQSDLAHNAHLKECWSSIKDHTHAWNLDSMLIKPVQRITKYPLLFDDLLSSTTPVHPDYFAIRTAAQMSKAIATEIDEAKRRKDVVSNAINPNPKKTTSINVSPKDNRQPASKLLGLKRFKKDKSAPNASNSNVSLPLSKSTSSNESSLPAVVLESSLNALKDLVVKVEELDRCVRRVGKEVILWTAAAKEVLVAEDGVMKTWLRVVQLEPSDPTDRRMLEFRKVIDMIISEVWKELNDEIRQQIMPIFSKLLESTSNPRKVIHKRDTKYLDYTRYHALRASKKTVERIVIQSAGEFVALHTQLVDELPAFLEGCLRILDVALVGFAKAQARYHQGVKDRLSAFEEAWVVLPLSPNIERSPTNTKTSRGIVKAWHDGWAPYAEAMDHFQCTRPARTAATRIATFNAKPGSRPVSRSNSPMLSPGHNHALRHSASITSPTSLSGSSRPSSPAPNKSGRFRSSSLRSQTGPSPQVITVTSPTQSTSSMFSLLRRSNSKNNVTKLRSNSTSQNQDGGNNRPSMHARNASGGGLKPSSSSIISEASSRLSWGLPRINADPSQPIFDGLGLSPTKPSSATLTRNNSHRATSDPIGQNNIFSVDLNSSQVSLSSSITNVNNDSPSNSISSRTASGSGVGLGLGDVSSLREKDKHPFSVIPATIPMVRRQRTDEVDAADGWRNEQVIYQCACVADFDPVELGDRRYRGLRFLPMISGDLIDVFHEVGRIDELPSFPYPEVGVDNDGVLVARSENGNIGLVICSFLEPLRD
ncbi:hypothetical protein V865_005309 [Kwoniella europaea PYCC6329]|uniref:DH domain-containing protein n=1 Tax=Kwoniella europaea PYCC6329 TaxID=1423913 RepID=A0AAX4KLJ4_9TREE